MGEIVQTHNARRCDFCGKTQDAVQYLIVSPGMNADICDECVEACSEIVAEKRAAKAASEASPINPEEEKTT